jgi:hypothetical protein
MAILLETWHVQSATETVSSHVTRAASKFHFYSQFSYNEQVRQLGQSNRIYAKNKMPHAMLADGASCVPETALSSFSVPQPSKRL